MSEWTVEQWISETEMQGIDYSEYWNDEEEEKKKEWYILDGNFEKMERYIDSTGLVDDLARCVAELKARSGGQLAGTGIDLAAGNLWAAAHLFQQGDVKKLYCVEFSKHRLLKIGPAVLAHCAVSPEKVVLVQGSFLDLHLPDASLDFVFMSQAFHHAEDPRRLLSEVSRVLKPNGVVIIIGEHVIKFRTMQVRHIIKYLVSRLVPKATQRAIFGKTFTVRSASISERSLLPPDPILGDHYYSYGEYREMFAAHGFQMKRILPRDARFQSFVLTRAKA